METSFIKKPEYLHIFKKGKKYTGTEKDMLSMTQEVIINELEKERNIFNHWASEGDTQGLTEFGKRTETLLLLGTHSEMIKIWQTFMKWANEYEPEYRLNALEDFLKDFIFSIKQSLEYQNKWEDLPLKEREITHNNIINKIEDIAKDLIDYDLDNKDWVSSHNQGNDCYIYYDDTYIDESLPPERSTYRKAYEKRIGISLSCLLLEHASRLKEQKRYQVTLYKNSKSNTDKRLRKFANYMAIANTKNFGKPYDSLISILASAFFPEENTDIEAIRSLIGPVKKQLISNR